MKIPFSILLLLCFCQMQAQKKLLGEIIDSENSQPIAGVHIQFDSGYTLALSDDKGHFEITAIKSADSININFSHVAYQSEKITVAVLSQIDKGLQIKMKKKWVMADEVTVNSIRAGDRTPITFTKINQDEIEKNNLGKDLVFLLDQTPSSIVSSDAGAGVGYTGIRIRGSDPTRINVTVNGIPINDAESQNVFWVNMPDFASSIESAVIQRGVGTSTHGAAAFGANMDLQTVHPENQPHIEINNSYGSFNTLKNTLKLSSGNINQKISIDGRLSHIRSDGYMDRASSKLKSYFLSANYKGKKSIFKWIHFSGAEKTFQAWYGVPQDSLKTNRKYNFYNYPKQIDKYRQDHYQTFYTLQINSKWLLNTALHYTYGRGFFEQYIGPEFNNDDGFNVKVDFASLNLPNFTTENDTIFETSLIRQRWLKNHFYGTTFSIQFQPNNRFHLQMGGAANRYNGKHFGDVIWMEFSPVAHSKPRLYKSRSNKDDLSFYAKAHYALTKKWNGFADVQFRYIQYEAKGTELSIGNFLIDKNYLFFNPKIGVQYHINPLQNYYFSFAIGNREPLRSDFIDNTLLLQPKHETLYNIESGYAFVLNHFKFQVNYYAMYYHNQLTLTGELNDVGAPLRTNVSKSYRTGIETQWAWKFNSKWEWSGNLTLSRNKIKKTQEILPVYNENFEWVGVEKNILKNTDLALSPDVIASSSLRFEAFKNFEIALISKYVGKQFLDHTQNQQKKIGDFMIHHLNLNYQIKNKNEKLFFKTIKFQIQLHNLLNQKYQTNGYTFSQINLNSITQIQTRENFNFYYPQARFHFLAGLSLIF